MTTYKVLLVDDDDDDYIVTRDLLEEAIDSKFQLTWVDNYQEGLETIRQNQHDVYLLDYRLGAESGLELLKEAIHYGCRKPIILLTGMGSHDIDKEAIAMGASDYLVKGVLLNSPLLERSILHSIERKRSQETIALLNHGIQNLRDCVYITDIEGTLIFLNHSLSNLSNLKAEDLIGRSIKDLSQPQLTKFFHSQTSCNKSSKFLETEILMKVSKEKASIFLLSESCIQDRGKILRCGVLHNITQRKQAERERDRFFRLSLDLLFIADNNGKLKRINPAWEKVLGYKLNTLIDQSFWSFIHPKDKNLITIARDVINKAEQLNSLEVRFRKQDQTYLWIAWNIVPYPQEKLLYGVGHDISERKASEIELVYKNRHDSLTKLNNRAYFLEKLEQLINKTKNQSNNAFAVLFIDLDDFKQINDNLGHLIGDELLIKFGEILKKSVRETDSVARLGGDEFTILLTYFNHPKDVIKVIDRIQERLKSPVKLGEEQVLIKASIGVVFSNSNYCIVDEIIRDADIAMYKAKAKGKGCYEIFANDELRFY